MSARTELVRGASDCDRGPGGELGSRLVVRHLAPHLLARPLCTN